MPLKYNVFENIMENEAFAFFKSIQNLFKIFLECFQCCLKIENVVMIKNSLWSIGLLLTFIIILIVYSDYICFIVFNTLSSHVTYHSRRGFSCKIRKMLHFRNIWAGSGHFGTGYHCIVTK